MNKGSYTHLIAFALSLLGFLTQNFWWGELLLTAGLFALSGSLTNGLAVHMLFERIPGVYGSGVVTNRFEAFKTAIREMMLNNFFSPEQFKIIAAKTSSEFNFAEPLLAKLDLDQVFDDLLQSIKSGHLGSLLALIGGLKALEPLREPVKTAIREQIQKLAQRKDLNEWFKDYFAQDFLRPKVEQLVDQRLAELTPQKIKQLVSQMIKEHLGWLVVWGGVFGGLLGGLSFLLLNAEQVFAAWPVQFSFFAF